MANEIANGNDEFYSKSENGKVEYFLDEDNMPTMDYPHVHVIHHPDRVTMHCSSGEGEHSGHVTMPGEPDGQTVQEAIAECIRKLFGF